MPIGDIPQLMPGQVVSGEISRVAAGLQIRLSPQSAAASAHTANATSLPQVVANVLESLSALGAAEHAAQALHPLVPANEAAVRNVLSLFLSDGRTGNDLQLLQGLFSDAAQAGALSQRMADSFALLVSTLVFGGDRDLRTVLNQWRRGGRTFEGRLALAVQSGRLDEILAETENDLRGLLMRARQEATFMRFLRAQGRFREFQETSERVLDRLTGAALQNLRSLEQPYVFLEVPVFEDTGLYRLQVHFMSERGDRSKQFDSRNCTVAIDVSLSRLGDLWIVLKLVQSECSCLIRAVDNEILDALRPEEQGFVDSLETAGFERARVRFGLWEGDRLREVGQFLRQYTGMNMRA
ncbi:MAG: hypothetical protein U9Q79_08905 [Candidatus Hydrogenedentes bacterium]|nr:hypothetical protein [Candidatus Hydrogenedentota bacterium]